jgi:alcohol dehydrogenase class IV
MIGSFAKVMHGITSAIMLSPVLRFTQHRNAPAQAKVVKIFNEVLGWDEAEAGEAVHKFVKLLGLPTKLSEVGVVDDDQIKAIADKTMTDIWGGGKPQLAYDEILQILDLAR